MNLKELIITSIVVIILVVGYCALFAFILLSSTNPVGTLLIITILIAIFGTAGLLIVSGTRVISSHPPIAKDAGDVGISPLDCFTWGHIAFGALSFLVDLIIIEVLSIETGSLLYWGLTLTLLMIGISWDIIENTLFIEIGIKFENRRDSTINIFSDVLFVCIGGLLMLGIYLLTGMSFIITGLIGIIVLVICGLLFIIRYRMVVTKRENK